MFAKDMISPLHDLCTSEICEASFEQVRDRMSSLTIALLAGVIVTSLGGWFLEEIWFPHRAQQKLNQGNG
jgi:hypothetical protein